jgi:anaerobic selenocysteine-containing dehydrogenase
VVDNQAVKIQGNPLYPINKGGICMKGHAGLQALYNPDRLQGPMKRERGSQSWQSISWEEAIQLVVDRLRALRKQKKSHTLMILGGQYRGYRDRLWKRFAEAYGTPNYIRSRCFEPEKAAKTHFLMQGLTRPMGYDLRETNFLLSFGCNLLESWISPVYQLAAYGHLRQGRPGRSARMVQIDPRHSITASKADTWIPIKPGTDGALALGMAYVIIREALYDRKFVERYTFGFEDWVDESGASHRGFKRLVSEEYNPLRVSDLTGVPVKTIFSLAREFAAQKPALALGERGPAFHSNDIYTRMAIHSLNALTGNIGKPGTLFVQGDLPLTPWEPAKEDNLAQQGGAMPRVDGAGEGKYFLTSDVVERLPKRILIEKPYPVNAMFLFHTNPLFSHPNKVLFASAFEKIPFIVSFSPYLDESSQYADLILPDHTYLERWQDDPVKHLAGFTLFGISRSVVNPLYNTRDTVDVLLEISHRFGEPMESAFPWETYEDILYEGTQGLFESGRGHVIDEPAKESFRKIMERQGYRVPEFEFFDEFWEALLAQGAWWDPADSYGDPRRMFKTQSRKFEFYALNLKKQMKSATQRVAKDSGIPAEKALEAILSKQGLQVRDDRLYLPHFEPVPYVGDEKKYPFHLNTYKLMSYAGGGGANQPWLQENLAAHLKGKWDSWVEINPQVAQNMGITDGAWVWLESPKGRVKVKARLYAGTAHNMVNLPVGQGHLAYGRWAKGRGVNPNDLIINTDDTLKGFGVWGMTRVRIIKI